MATAPELLSEIRRLLRALSDRVEELAAQLEPLGQGRNSGGMAQMQSLEPPPAEPFEGIEEREAESLPSDADEPKTSETRALAEEEPTEEAGALGLLEELNRLQETVHKHKLEVSPKDFAFIPKSTEVYAALSKEERVGTKGARIVLDCVNFLDTIAYKYVGVHYAPLGDATAALTQSLAEFLYSETGYKVFPLDEKDRSEIEDVAPDYSAAVQEKHAYSKLPSGSILAVRRRGAMLGSDVVRKAQILTSSGEQSEVDRVLEDALNVVSSLRGDSDRAVEMKLKAMSSLTEWREKLYGSSADHELTVARYALNLLHTLETGGDAQSPELFSGPFQKLKKINNRIVSILRAGGLSEILISIGGMFDESYDPSKYERKKVPSDKPPGTIVKLLRKGFLDRNGIPIQKAVVAVSG